MAAEDFWGSNPDTTTVLASPSPTTTSFTVDDITEFLEEAFILVEVSGEFERVQIASISGSQITLATALSGTPDVPGAVKSGRTLITNTKLNNSAIFNADDIASLKAVDTTSAPNGLRYQIAGMGIYRLDKDSTRTADDSVVIEPTTGGGRWISQYPVFGHVYAGASVISGSTFANLDGAGVPFLTDRTASDVTWASGGNDGAYETLGASLSVDLKGSKTLYIITGETDDGSTGPLELQLDIDGSTVNTINSVPTANASITQKTSLFSYAALSSTLAAGSTDFDTTSERRTGRDASKIRSYVLELPPTDDDSNAMVQEYTTALTFTQATSSTFVDITGATATGTFQSGNKALILFGNSQRSNSTGAFDNRTRQYRLMRDGVEVFATDSSNAISYFKNQGGYDELTRVVDVTGAHTFKMQGNRTSGTTQNFAEGGNGYFGMIELPAVYGGVTLLRSTVDLADTQSQSQTFEDIGDTGVVATNGLPLLIMVSGHFYNSPNGATDCIALYRFQVDGVTIDSEYSIRAAETTRYGALMIMVDDIPAGDHTFTLQYRQDQAVGAHRFYDTQFSVIEMPIADPAAGDAPSVTVTSATGKKMDIQYNGTITPSVSSTVTLQATQDGTAVGNPLVLPVLSGNTYGLSFRTIADAPPIGTSPVYRLQGKVSTGTANVSAGDFTTQEIGGS